MKLSELHQQVESGCVEPLIFSSPVANDPEITGITADSRKVEPGFLFVALKGNAVDGAKYIASAVEAGAAAILTYTGAGFSAVSIPVAQINDPRPVLSALAAAFYPQQPETMVAVTGTAGKTSVVAFVRQIWEQAGFAAASIGTTGVVAPGRDDYGSLTTPDPVGLHQLLGELATGGVTHAAMEASSHGLDQYRMHGTRLSAAGFTNLGRDHMDYHPTVEHYFAAKMRLFTELLPEGAPAVVFADDPWSQKAMDAAKQAGRRPFSVGRGGDFISLKRVEHERFSQIAELQHEGMTYRIRFPLAGDFQIANGLVAAGLAITSGTDAKAAIHGLEHLQGAPGRLDLVGKSRDQAPCYVDYAHKPEALENVLQSLRPFTTGKLVCIFGCGGDRDPGKRPIMGEIAGRLADVVIVTDDNPRSENPALVRAAIMETAKGASEIGDRRQAIETGVEMLGPGDCLVVAGKGHETGQLVDGVNHPFSDHEVLRAALVARGGEAA